MKELRKKRQDYLLSLGIFSLIAFGLIMIFSVSKYYSLQITNGESDKYYLAKQLKFLGLGLISWIVFQQIDYRVWQKYSGSMLFVAIFLILLPLLPFSEGSGVGARWINIGFLSFQPSEIAKLALIFYLSGWFSSKRDKLAEVNKLFVPFLLVIGGISLLMLVQKDLGTLASIVFISASIVAVAGMSGKYLAGGGMLGIFFVWLAIKIEPYRLQRLLTFLNPENDSLSAGYHIRNALIAIGSGGLWGLGFGQSRQKYLYLPESHTDSIFAITSEELGFLRAALIIVLFAFISLRGYKIAKNAPDTFSRLVATGITTWFFAQMFINVAAMLSLVPLTGVPLPFISYGGSSLVILLSAVGVLVNISKNQSNNKVFER